MTEETQQQADATVTTPQEQNATGHPGTDGGKTKESKKEKCRPMTKVVIRRLPSSMTQEQFLEQVSPLPEYDYMYFAKADMSLGQYAFSRAYIDFVDPQDIFAFREKFDNYVFVDAKGQEYPAVVEYAPFQRVPKKRVGKKKDLKCGTIESDPYYISFLESLKNQEGDTANTQPKTEYSFQPSDHAPKKVTSTPLLDFLKQRKQEKQRLRDEKREEKRRRDLERKRSKDEPMVSKVLKNLEEREKEKDKDFNRENKENKDEKDRILQKDLKNRNKQQKEDRYRDKLGRDREGTGTKVPTKNFRDRDDRIKDREIKQNKKHEEKKFFTKKEVAEVHVKEERVHDKEEISYKERKLEEKRGKSYEKMRQEKKRLAETQKKQNTESTQDEPDEDHDNIDDDGDEDDDDNCMTSSTEKTEFESKPKLKNKKTIDSVKNNDEIEKMEHSSDICHVSKTESAEESESQITNTDDKLKEVCERLTPPTTDSSTNPPDLSPGHLDKKASPSSKRITKRRSSLESGGENSTSISTSDSGEAKDTDSGASLRRHKSLDGGDDSNLRKEVEDKEGKEETSGGKKDPRLERRIRNKDRPAMEIYRPGMGKFSKQRLEREKSSTEERATPSQSPTPTTATISSSSTTTATTTTATSATGNSAYKTGKPNGAEVRSMTFKRSVSRDVS